MAALFVALFYKPPVRAGSIVPLSMERFDVSMAT